MHKIDALIAEAIHNDNKPRVHGNGFIQLDVNPQQRLHFWGHPYIPRAKPMTPIHDHVFPFQSDILFGNIVNLNYKEVIKPHGLYEINQAADPKPGVDGWGLQPTGARCDLIVLDYEEYEAGQTYYMPPNIFHETLFHAPAITLIHKDGLTLAQNPGGPRPRILIPWGQGYDSKFDRNAHPQSLLWATIADISKQATL
jgi:hypothetical protein